MEVRRALDLAIERGQGRDAAILYNNLAAVVAPVDGPAASLAVLREGITFAERRGLVEDVRRMQVGSLDVLFDLGWWDEVIAAAREREHEFQASGTELGAAVARTGIARILGHRGVTEKARRVAASALDAARVAVVIGVKLASTATAAFVNLAAGDRASAASLLIEIEAAPHAREDIVQYATNLQMMARSAVAPGDFDLAQRLVSGVESRYAYPVAAFAASRAAVAETKGAMDRAAVEYAAAAVGWRTLGVVPELAFALLGRGRCERPLGRAAAGANWKHQADRMFRRLGV